MVIYATNSLQKHEHNEEAKWVSWKENKYCWVISAKLVQYAYTVSVYWLERLASTIQVCESTLQSYKIQINVVILIDLNVPTFVMIRPIWQKVVTC